MNFNRNNLDKAASPYLRQHQDNPVFWQEWNKDTLNYAKSTAKPIFLSVGYSTCHWCHVMAREAFSDQEIADYLNAHFVTVKVDREERPDIDQFAMSFITATKGQGGWPLNVALSSTGDPFFAGTYFPVESTASLSGFLDVLRQIHEFYKTNAGTIRPFQMPVSQKTSYVLDELAIIAALKQNFDEKYHGFGWSTKFPPHTTLLYLLYYHEISRDTQVMTMITRTLDAMTKRGLHDHLMGGFFRYCTDRKWIIPHFEKMLYDQAMLLWVYSLSFKLFGRSQDKTVVDKIMSALARDFDSGSGYFSGIDADTNHREGGTYLWHERELRELLTKEAFVRFSEVYDLSAGQYEGKVHLIKSADVFLPDIEKKLLAAREKRPQPAVDKKIITSWNALVGIGFMLAGRHTGHDSGLDKAVALAETLLEKHYIGGKLIHSSTDGIKQKAGFLEDYAALTLFLSYLFEERGLFKKELGELWEKTQQFFQYGVWLANSETEDFHRVTAEAFDHPQPSAVSLAEYASYRVSFLLDLEELGQPVKNSNPLSSDFHNIVALLAKGNAYEIHAPHLIDWQEIPITAIQAQSNIYQICHNFQCREYDSEANLLAELAR